MKSQGTPLMYLSALMWSSAVSRFRWVFIITTSQQTYWRASATSVGQMQNEGRVFQSWASKARSCRDARRPSVVAGRVEACSTKLLASGRRLSPQYTREVWATWCRRRGMSHALDCSPSTTWISSWNEAYAGFYRYTWHHRITMWCLDYPPKRNSG